MKKVGMYGGKFIPFHKGHLYSILKVAAMVDQLYVVVSYVERRDKELCEKAKLPYIDFKQRALWIRQETKHLPNVTVLYVEDIDMMIHQDLDYIWGEGAKRIIAAIPETITHIFSSESSYDVWWKKFYGDITHVIIDEERTNFPVSATKIREEGVFACWDMIPESCKPFYVKKVVILGVESVGKTTLTQSLANMFNTVHTEEYGRTLSEILGNGSDLLTEKHYQEIVYGNKYLESQAIKKANKLLFVDTEAVITQYYAKMYMGQEYEFVESVIETQEYDLYIYLEPDVKWVADGFRTYSDESIRKETNEILKNMLHERGIEFVSVDGNYQERLDKCIELVNNLI